MPLMERAVQAATNRMPKLISPKLHAIMDYALAGTFLAVGALLWKHNKKAAISSFIWGGAGLGTAMTTDYPGGIWPRISFPTHGKIDAGFAGVIGSMPNLMRFDEHRSSWFFRTHAMTMAAVTGLTDFESQGAKRGRARRAA
jgi:hypothetical protein